MTEEPAQNALLDLIFCSTRSEFEKLCATITLTNRELAQVILAAKVGNSPVNHRKVDRKLLPDHMEILERDTASEDLKAGNPRKLMSKISPIFDHPRHLTAHFLWIDDGATWWAVVFNYLDLSQHRRTWVGGPHVHMLSYLTHPRSSPNDFVEEILLAEKPRLPHPVHIRFRRE